MSGRSHQRSYPCGLHLGLKWEVVSNHFDGDTFRATLTITNHGDVSLPGSGWAMYFNSCRKPLPDSATGEVVIEHVNGDLFKLLPGAHFGSLAPGASREIGYLAALWAVVETDAPAGFFIVYDEGTAGAAVEAVGDPEIVPFSRAEQVTRTSADRVPRQTAALTFDDNRDLSLLPDERVGRITPAPLSASYGAGVFRIARGTTIVHPPELSGEASLLKSALALLLTHPPQLAAADQANAIRLRLDAKLGALEGGVADQAYRLDVSPDGVEITGRTAEAVHYGMRSLLQLLPLGAWQNRELELPVPVCEVMDAPRFAYRGLHLDVARNFSDKRTVLRIIDLMALYKLNRLHFHLTDDEGWRIPIASLPELTEIGSRRGFGQGDCLLPSFGSGPEVGHRPGSGHYSRQDFIDILRHARERHIEVIPEIDLPGHARAAIQAMQKRYERLRAAGQNNEADEYRLVDLNDMSKYESVQMWKDNVVCIGLESCYRFIDTVVGDIKALYAESGTLLRTLHVGGDEVPHGAWEHSPLCQAFMREQGMTSVRELEAYFFARLCDILHRHGIGMAGWEEVALADQSEAGVTVSRPNPKLVSSGLRPYVWNNVWGWGREDIAYRLANAGFEIVLCNVTNLYLDLAYEKDPAERGYYWGGFLGTRKVFEFCPFDIYSMATVDLLGHPLDAEKLAQMERLTPEGEKRVLGLQGHLWGENLRSGAVVEYMLVPRLIAVAERAWAKDPRWTLVADRRERSLRMDEDWNEFANRLGRRELPRLDAFFGGIEYRIPVPGMAIEGGALSANVSAPGMTLRYTLDGTEPLPTSAVYEKPVPVPSGARPKVATFTTTGRRSRSATADVESSEKMNRKAGS